MKLMLIILGSLMSLQVFAVPKLNGREIKVITGGTKLMGANPSWSVKDNKVGVACSRLHGSVNPETNEISAVCKVCYSAKYDHSNWSPVQPLKEGDIFKGTSMHIGGGTEISENYGCDLDAQGELQCNGESFVAVAKNVESNKEINISCTSKMSLERSDLNEIFKGSLEFF